MSRAHNLPTVIKHEVRTILKQPTFWITIFAIPAFMAVVLGLSYLSGTTTDARIKEAAEEVKNIAVVDHSGIIHKQVAQQYQITLLSDENTAINEVRQGELDGLFVYPADIAKTHEAKVYVSDAAGNGFLASGGLSEVATQLFTQSLLAPLGSDERIQLAQESINTSITTFKEDGSESQGIAEYIAPGAFMVLFFVTLVMSLPYIVTGVADEKENRVMELLLTSVKPRLLMTGKLLAVAIITLIQISLLLGLAAGVVFVAYQLGGDNFDLPLSLGDIVFDPQRIALGAGFFITGYLIFAALMMGISSLMPSAKEANGLIAPFMFAAIIPIYLFGTLASDPGSIVTKIASFFPLSAPISMLIRNTVGSVGLLEGLLALAVLSASMVAAFWLATVFFNRGALAYSSAPQVLKMLARGKK